jgi:hypothetical protein
MPGPSMRQHGGCICMGLALVRVHRRAWRLPAMGTESTLGAQSARRPRISASPGGLQVGSLTAAEREDVLSHHAAAVCAALGDRDGNPYPSVPHPSWLQDLGRIVGQDGLELERMLLAKIPRDFCHSFWTTFGCP